MKSKYLISILLIIILMFSLIAYATPSDGARTVTTISQEQNIIDKLKNFEVYSVSGYSQMDIIKQNIEDNRGYYEMFSTDDKKPDKVTVDNFYYGNVIYGAIVHASQIDELLQMSIIDFDKVTERNGIKYVELKYKDKVFSLMKIDEKDRIVEIIEPGIIGTNLVQEAINNYVDTQVEIIENDKYITGMYVKNSAEEMLIKYTDFNSTDESQMNKTDVETVIKDINEKYLIDNPKIDPEIEQKAEEARLQKQAEDNKKMDIVVYSIVGGAVLVLAIIIIIALKKFNSIVD